MTSTYKSSLAVIDDEAEIAEGVSIWHFSQIRDRVLIGENTSIGKSVYVDSGVRIGRGCKIQNNAQLYSPCFISDFVFVGPGVVLTNDKSPRATSPDGLIKKVGDWQAVGVEIQSGASVGANSVCIAPITIGKWAMIGAGSVVTKDVPNYAIVFGNPAKQVGWVGEAGQALIELSKDRFKCPVTSSEYKLSNEGLVKIETK